MPTARGKFGYALSVEIKPLEQRLKDEPSPIFQGLLVVIVPVIIVDDPVVMSGLTIA
jgi:hypothetical protein